MSRNVSFAPMVEVRLTTCIDEMSDEEITASWFSDREFSQNRKRDRRFVKELMENRPEFTEDAFLTSGLETEPSKARRRVRVREAQLSVLLKQEELWNESEEVQPCADAIAEVYLRFTLESREFSKLRGAKVAAQIRKLSPTRRSGDGDDLEVRRPTTPRISHHKLAMAHPTSIRERHSPQYHPVPPRR